MKNESHPGSSVIGTRLWLSVFLLGATGCEFGTYADSYLKQAPPTDCLCGVWVIDSDATTWDDAKRRVKTGDTQGTPGFLRLKSDGSFTLEDLPGFPYGGSASGSRAAGTWQTDVDSQGLARLRLRRETMQRDSVVYTHMYFQRSGAHYVLHLIIGDPDVGDVLVLRRSQE